jgi:hypothetical protein
MQRQPKLNPRTGLPVGHPRNLPKRSTKKARQLERLKEAWGKVPIGPGRDRPDQFDSRKEREKMERSLTSSFQASAGTPQQEVYTPVADYVMEDVPYTGKERADDVDDFVRAPTADDLRVGPSDYVGDLPYGTPMDEPPPLPARDTPLIPIRRALPLTPTQVQVMQAAKAQKKELLRPLRDANGKPIRFVSRGNAETFFDRVVQNASSGDMDRLGYKENRANMTYHPYKKYAHRGGAFYAARGALSGGGAYTIPNRLLYDYGEELGTRMAVPIPEEPLDGDTRKMTSGVIEYKDPNGAPIVRKIKYVHAFFK